MPKFYPLQQKFNGGEISPRLYGQANTERYLNSLESMTNFIALPQGPAMRRQGFAYVDDALNSTDVRLLPFKVPGSTDYVVELGPGYISILTRDGREQFSTNELIKNGDFKEGLLNWVFATTSSTGYVTTVKDLKRANINMVWSDANNTSTMKQVIATGATTGIVDFVFSWASDFVWSPAIGGSNIYDNQQVNIKLGTADGLGDLYSAVFKGSEADDYTVVHRFVDGNFQVERRLGFGSESVQVDILSTDPVYLTYEYVRGDLGTYSFPVSIVGSYLQNISLGGEAVTSETFVTPWLTESDLALVQYVAESGGGRMYFTHPSYAPQLLELSSGSWSFGAMTLVSPPASWAVNNWPSVVEFYQGRLWLAATPAEASTIWGSKSGDPFNFTIGNNDDDSFELPLSTTGGIKWLKGQKGMVVGTDIGEQVITSEGSLITPTDRKATEQSGWGSVDIQPSLAGNDIVYISQDRTKVRAVNTSFSTGSWVSVDLTWVAEHITRNRIIESIYIQNPNYQLYFILADGSIVACTYDREHEVVGWMRLVTDGEFLSMTKTDSVEGTVLWVAVRRNGNIRIEAIDPEESIWQFTDSWVRGMVGVDGLVTGLDHLEGLTVQVLVDGAIEPDQVVTGGEITVLNTAGEFAVVGLEYEAEMTTLPLGQGNPAGTALGSLRRYSRIFVQLFDSALPRINGQLPPDRSPSTPMNTVQPNLTGDIDVRNLGRDNGGRVTITQNLPKKTMVTAIYGKADQEQT